MFMCVLGEGAEGAREGYDLRSKWPRMMEYMHALHEWVGGWVEWACVLQLCLGYTGLARENTQAGPS
jgi:hypothetical protein